VICSISKHSKRSSVSGVPYELIIEKIRNTPEPYPDGDSNGYFIPHQEQGDVSVICKIYESEHHSDDPPVKTHSSLINSEHFEGMLDIVGEIIESYVSNASSENYATHHTQSKEIEVHLTQYSTRFDPEIRSEYTHRVGKPVVGRSNGEAEDVEFKDTH
jgi:hypothetical protein